MSNLELKKIPTNVITGFLGVGKTSAILNLLANKPTDERWAVLVNEFGEVGIDGSYFSGSAPTKENVHIKEVPGGCMCCASGVSMRVALNVLLDKAKPDRLLVEPSGIGHPEGVIDILNSQFYQNVIELHQTLVLVDARKITDERYYQHPTYLQQLDVADVVVANKADLYEQDDYTNLVNFLEKRFGEKAKPCYPITQAGLPISLLSEQPLIEDDTPSTQSEQGQVSDFSIEEVALEQREELSFPPSGFVSIKNKGNGFFSCGWVFKAEILFDALKLQALFTDMPVERIKGVFLTLDGPIAYHVVDGELTHSTLNESQGSRLEMITKAPDVFEQFEVDLLNCVKESSASESVA